jgi:hypothetical protein
VQLLFKLFRQCRDNLEQIAHNAIVGNIENRCVGCLFDKSAYLFVDSPAAMKAEAELSFRVNVFIPGIFMASIEVIITHRNLVTMQKGWPIDYRK